MQVAGNNGYGGEGCEDTYKWEDYEQLCGSNGLVKYINDFQMGYLNVSTRDTMSGEYADD